MYNFGLRVRGEFVNPDLLDKEYYIICWSASWVGSNEVYSGCVTPQAARKWSDKAILKPIWKLMDEADVISGHNVSGFDIKRLNARFLLNGMNPPLDFAVMDTLKVARNRFSFESNKLDYIAKRLGFRPKDAMGLDDWKKIAESGDEKTLAKMQKYNKGDVREGKKVLETLKGWAGKPKYFGSRAIPMHELEKLVKE